MAVEEDSLHLQLHKLSAISNNSNAEETLDHILTTLWKTRRTGLRSPEKSHIKSLLNLDDELDPVLACLRSLIRKIVHENLSRDDILKVFPADLSLHLQRILLLLLQKYQNQWKDDLSKEQHQLPRRTSVCYQVKTSMPMLSSYNSVPLSSEISVSSWPRQDDLNSSHVAPVSIQHDDASTSPHDNLVILPRLKSMTWTMENRNSPPASKVAVITVKLQDFTKSPSGETEVKFQLTKDTVEAMLRSMTYISEQLSSMVPTSSGPVQKKQKQ